MQLREHRIIQEKGLVFHYSHPSSSPLQRHSQWNSWGHVHPGLFPVYARTCTHRHACMHAHTHMHTYITILYMHKARIHNHNLSAMHWFIKSFCKCSVVIYCFHPRQASEFLVRGNYMLCQCLCVPPGSYLTSKASIQVPSLQKCGYWRHLHSRTSQTPSQWAPSEMLVFICCLHAYFLPSTPPKFKVPAGRVCVSSV